MQPDGPPAAPSMRSHFVRLVRSGRPMAAGIHFALSLAAVGALAAMMLWSWYPQPYFMHDGGWTVLRLILAVDVVLGPLLTLIVFDRAKKSLRRDLAIIAATQVAALAYGAGIMYQYRPAFVAELDGNFYTVTWPDLARGSPDLAPARTLSDSGNPPVPVSIALPANVRERLRLRDDAKQSGVALIYRANLYAAMTPERMRMVLEGGAKVPEIAARDPVVKRELDRVLRVHGLPVERLAFVPLQCRYGLIILVYDRSTGERLDWMT